VRSDVNLALLRALNAAGVEIPYPQRVVRQIVEAAPSEAPSR
jgi:small-conductance mechanosensitive channel